MNGAMKMMMIANRGKNDGQRDNRDRSSDNRSECDQNYQTTRNEYNGSDMNYGVEGRFRGDGEYNRYHEQVTGNYDDAESRRYRRDDRGRFRSENDMEVGDNYGTYAHYGTPYPLVPPVYEAQDNYPRMGKIGFSTGGELDREYRTSADYPQMNEAAYSTSPTMMGHGKGNSHVKLTKEMADEWMEGLQNEDGTRGPHWKMDHVKQIMSQRGIEADPIQFYAILNAIYSDYCKVLKKHGVGDRVDIYVDLACAWLNDKDAVKDKASSYFEHTVKH